MKLSSLVVFAVLALCQVYANFPYSANANACHELGHVLYLKHQYTDPDNAGASADYEGSVTNGLYDEHDYGDLCVMSYLKCDGDYCGRCLLQLRGYDLAHLAANRAEPRPT